MPPITAAAGSTDFSMSVDSTPFWNGITTVRLPMIGLICAAALSVSHSLTANITASTGPASAGSSNTLTFSLALPCGLSIVRPSSRIAARCLPRAKNTTSCPACCRRAPK